MLLVGNLHTSRLESRRYNRLLNQLLNQRRDRPDSPHRDPHSNRPYGRLSDPVINLRVSHHCSRYPAPLGVHLCNQVNILLDSRQHNLACSRSESLHLSHFNDLLPSQRCSRHFNPHRNHHANRQLSPPFNPTNHRLLSLHGSRYNNRLLSPAARRHRIPPVNRPQDLLFNLHANHLSVPVVNLPVNHQLSRPLSRQYSPHHIHHVSLVHDRSCSQLYTHHHSRRSSPWVGRRSSLLRGPPLSLPLSLALNRLRSPPVNQFVDQLDSPPRDLLASPADPPHHSPHDSPLNNQQGM